MATTQDDTISELQHTIAGLQEKLDAALAQRSSEYSERIAHQTATIDVLKVMSASPGDPQPVFDLICCQARTLLDVAAMTLYEYDGKQVHLIASDGAPAMFGAAGWEAYKSGWPRTPDRGSLTCRAILDGAIIHIRDLTTEPGVSQVIRSLGHKAQVSIPLMRDRRAIGAISTGSLRVDGISDSQIELLKAFAEQAVIAITSAETYRALQGRTAELQESLEYQTATSDVLKVISHSTFDLQPVLDTVVQTSARLCNADRAAIFRREGDLWRLAVNFGFPPAWEEYMRAQGAFSLDLFSEHAAVRAVVERRPVHIDDLAAVPGYGAVRLGEQRTTLGVPLLREGEAIGTIVLARLRVEPFTDRQIELVSTFADQAVIAMENARLITEQREALERQTATAEVLQVINTSPGNLAPVFDVVLEKAIRLCDSAFGTLTTYDGRIMRCVATRGLTPEQEALLADRPPATGQPTGRIAEGEEIVHLLDARDQDGYRAGFGPTRYFVDQCGARTVMWVALRKEKELLGMLTIFRREVRAFADQEIALVQNFAAQAVIAMENARLLNEQREALEQQTATAEVLQVINANPGNLAPVFETILEKAHSLIGAVIGALVLYEGPQFRAVATHGFSEQHNNLVRQPHGPTPGHLELLDGRRFKHYHDLRSIENGQHDAVTRSHVENNNARTALWVPLRKDDRLLGLISVYRLEVRPFLEKEIALLENFAAQAVIAMENARLLDEIRQRQEELRITFENMGDGVAMFDETPRLIAWNRKFQDILHLPDGVLADRLTFAEYIRYLTERGEYGREADPEEHARRLIEQAGQSRTYERNRPDGRVLEIRQNPVASGGFVLIYADITERKRNEAEIRAARDAAEEASRTIEVAYRDLKAAQANLIQAEKMASLGQLTAGIAHEIKNPLNFVNNFAALSVDLLGELKDAIVPAEPALNPNQRAEVDEVVTTLTSNLEKITEHGKRADGIVTAMLEHSRGSSAERRVVNLNALIDEALNLAYHGARAQDQSFNITLERNFGEGIAPIEVNPQDMTRVFLNLFSNGFYAATRRARDGADAGFVPTLKVTTRDDVGSVEIRVWDNGTGISADIRDKLFQPFFTTKPTGEGTGLGLSITYDIVTKAHGGSIAVDSEVGEFSEFTIRLPRNP